MEQTATQPSAFEDVYRAQRLALIRLAFLLTGSREHAEDIVQSAFAGAHGRWSEVSNPPAYLRRAVVNLANDTHRRRFRERLLVQREETTDIPELDETWSEIKRLPASQRAVVVLRFYEDLPLAEIAVLLDRPPATVRSDLRRALDRLRRTLS
jgi:RNA polymerase sigma factor (sigma-70 family)